MRAKLETDEVLEKRLLPQTNPDAADRRQAWAEWQAKSGPAVLSFIRVNNTSAEPPEDLWQDTLAAAYVEVERGQYQLRAGVPFTAYVKGIARNKIRAARRRERGWAPLDEGLPAGGTGGSQRLLEHLVEQRAQRAALRHGLAQLPADWRAVLERYLRGERPAEIARQLGLTEALVRQRKHRGLSRLQQVCGRN